MAAHYWYSRSSESNGGLYIHTIPSGAGIFMPQAGSVAGMNNKLLAYSPGPLPISIEERSRFNFNLVLFGYQDLQVYLTRDELRAGPTLELTPRWGIFSKLLYHLRDYGLLWLVGIVWSVFWLVRVRPQQKAKLQQEALWVTGQLEVGMEFHQYRLLQLLGEGAAGAVYKADKPGHKSDGFYTLKVFHRQEGASDDKQEEALKKEFQNAAALTHPGIVYLLDWGVLRGYYYLVSEYVEGAPLNEIEDYTLYDVCLWGAQIAAALDYAHSCGVVHRDIKPANVLLDRGRRCKIVDFGIAARMDGTAEGGAGTIGYMAPEQAGGKVNPASDFYSLGVTLYRLASLRMPFQGDDPFQILAAQGLEQYQPLAELVPHCPKEFETVVDQMLRKEPSERLTDVVEIQDLLNKAASKLNP